MQLPPMAFGGEPDTFQECADFEGSIYDLTGPDPGPGANGGAYAFGTSTNESVSPTHSYRFMAVAGNDSQATLGIPSADAILLQIESTFDVTAFPDLVSLTWQMNPVSTDFHPTATIPRFTVDSASANGVKIYLDFAAANLLGDYPNIMIDDGSNFYASGLTVPAAGSGWHEYELVFNKLTGELISLRQDTTTVDISGNFSDLTFGEPLRVEWAIGQASWVTVSDPVWTSGAPGAGIVDFYLDDVCFDGPPV